MVYVNLIILFVSLALICFYARCHHFLRSLFLGASSGILTLGIIILFYPTMLKFNFFTMVMAFLAGAPGVILEILIKQFLI